MKKADEQKVLVRLRGRWAKPLRAGLEIWVPFSVYKVLARRKWAELVTRL